MTLKIVSPRSLAAAPLVLLAHAFPEKYALSFFTDHAAAQALLQRGEADILCTGFTEVSSKGAGNTLVASFVWGLSALLVRDAGVKNFSALTAAANEQLLLPFAHSPLDLQVRAIFKRQAPAHKIGLANAELLVTLQNFQQGSVFAAALPEPLATQLCMAGRAYRLADLAELWAEAFGEKMTPQVSCFVRADKNIPAGFLTDLQKTIPQLAQNAQLIGTALGQNSETILQALPHVLFALPEPAEALRLESAYRKTLDCL